MILKEIVLENWATALKNIAVELDKVDDFIEQSNALVEVLHDKNEFVKILTIKNDVLTEKQRVNIIDETFGQFGFDENIINAMKILVEMEAFQNARKIFKYLRRDLVDLHHLTYGVVWSTIELEEKQITAIESKIETKIGKPVKLVNKLDENLIGGVQVIVDNQIFDGTIKGKLDSMRYETLKNK
ncbi:F0F1 ATP synthase subunit delta [[Acholeplasma] multilocale]|uniref:F0F1 ATP synthase subunit delta n=1 Tax=[Acholeplasma] multilocale TaxID=264638 RepID=UPI00047B3A68|nr:F0F1 ATP synthase subunit delta [[Acholeplasma] multilocale]